MRISAHVRSALRGNARTSTPDPSFRVEAVPGTGRVNLIDVAYSESFRGEVEKVPRSWDRVSGADNRQFIVENPRAPTS